MIALIVVNGAQITSLFLKDMGIKDATIGGENIYSRSGGYIYIELKTTDDLQINERK